MRVLQVNSARDWGGGEVHTLDLCTGLRAAGCTVTVACRPNSALGERARQAGLAVLPLPLRGAFDMPSALALARFCRQHRVDVLHAHLARDYPLAALAGMLCPWLRVVVTRHLLFPMKRGVLNRWVWRRVQTVIAVSESVYAVLADHPDIPSERLVAIPNGIVTQAFATAAPAPLRQALGLPPETLLVGCVGTLGLLKGQETLIRAWPAVQENFPQVAMILVGSADREKNYQATLQELATELGIAETVHFLGHQRDIPGLMRAFDVFVLPSQQESFGLVMVEAMAAYRPVVATRVGGACEIVLDGETGRLVSVGDPEVLAGAIGELLADADLRQRWGYAGHARAVAQYDVATMVTRTLACYRRKGDSVTVA